MGEAHGKGGGGEEESEIAMLLRPKTFKNYTSIHSSQACYA